MLKLSEAIRLGAMLKPQSFGSMRSCEAVPSLGDVLGLRIIEKTCAMGAAYEAGYRSAPYLGVSTCPACVHFGPVPYLVMHLNDLHRWTREQIADWVESIELTQDATSVVERELVADGRTRSVMRPNGGSEAIFITAFGMPAAEAI